MREFFRKDVELANLQNKLDDGLGANGQLQKKVKELLARVQVRCIRSHSEWQCFSKLTALVHVSYFVLVDF